MLQRNLFSRVLKPSSVLSLSAVLLSSVFSCPSWAMDEDIRAQKTPVYKLETYNDLMTLNDLPPIKAEAILLLNIGHGMVQSAEYVTERNSDSSLFTQHKAFIDSIEQSNPEDYTALTVKRKLASGTEFVKVGEKGLPALLDKFNATGINIIPITSRCDDGRYSTENSPKVLSRTEKEFAALGYNWESWNKPAVLQKPHIELTLQDNNPEAHGAYKYRNGVIYSIMGQAPHKSAAIIGLVKKLQEEGTLPSAIYFTDGEKTINETSEDLKNIDLGVPVYPCSYNQRKAFMTPEDLKEFYIHRLGEKFKAYDSQFKEVFRVK